MKAIAQSRGRLRELATWHGAIDGISAIMAAVGGLALLLLLVIVAASVAARYFINKPLIFVDEVASYLMLGIVFLGLAPAVKAGGHIRVEVLVSRLSGRTARIVETAALVVAIVFGVVLLFSGLDLVQTYLARGTRSWAGLQTPLAIPAMVIPVGVVAFVLQLLKTVIQRNR